MTDPYKVLGVSPTPPTRKSKRRTESCQKVPPDNYVDNPSDLASDKMKEINEDNVGNPETAFGERQHLIRQSEGYGQKAAPV